MNTETRYTVTIEPLGTQTADEAFTLLTSRASVLARSPEDAIASARQLAADDDPPTYDWPSARVYVQADAKLVAVPVRLPASAFVLRGKLCAPPRRRPRRVARKIARRAGAQHYRDAATCAWTWQRRPSPLKRALMAAYQAAHTDALNAAMLHGDPK